MNSSYGLNAYRNRALNIEMRTSSGDKINLDFANYRSGSLRKETDTNGSKTSLKFSSMQSFKFSIKSNGIDKQDKKEIDSFMKIAQPFIDDFLKELSSGSQKSSTSQVSRKIASIFEPNTNRDQNTKNTIKSNIVNMFDRSLQKIDSKKTTSPIEDFFRNIKQLLEKTLKEFDQYNKTLYA